MRRRLNPGHLTFSKESKEISPEGTLLDWGAFRQARELAEGQKSADVQHRCRVPTPSARQ